MHTQTKPKTIMVTAASLVTGDQILLGNQLAVIVENRENIAWKGLRYITYAYEYTRTHTSTGTYRPDEMMEKFQ